MITDPTLSEISEAIRQLEDAKQFPLTVGSVMERVRGRVKIEEALEPKTEKKCSHL